MNNTRIDLTVDCPEHGIQPYSLLCSHIFDGRTNKAIFIEVKDGREVEFDYICPMCLVGFKEGIFIGDYLGTICTQHFRDHLKDKLEMLRIEPPPKKGDKS